MDPQFSDIPSPHHFSTTDEKQNMPHSVGEILSLLLRKPLTLMEAISHRRSCRFLGTLFLITFITIAFYGFIVGTFTGGEQLVNATLKISIGFFLVGLICLPSFYVFFNLMGVEVKALEAFGLLIIFQSLISILLLGFAPVSWVFAQSTESAGLMGFFHLLFWFVGVRFAYRIFQRRFASVSGVNRRLMSLWFVVFVFVSLQMTTALRPLLGSSPEFFPEKKMFFINHWLEVLDGGDKN